MDDCPGTDRAFERLARLGKDPTATLEDLDDDTAELPAVAEAAPKHAPAGGRHRAPARSATVRRVTLAVTGAALLAAMGVVVMTAPGGEDARPGVRSVPPPVVTSEPEAAPSSPRPNLVLPPPSRTRKPEPSTSPAPSSSSASPSPSPTRRAQSPAPPTPSPEEPTPPGGSDDPTDSPTPSGSPTTTPS